MIAWFSAAEVVNQCGVDVLGSAVLAAQGIVCAF